MAFQRGWIDDIKVKLARLDKLHVDIGWVQLLFAHFLVVQALRVGLPVVDAGYLVGLAWNAVAHRRVL